MLAINSFLYFFIGLNFSTAFVHRCIPTNEAIQEAYELLNSWTVTQQIFSDLYTTWQTVLIMCFVAFGLYPNQFFP